MPVDIQYKITGLKELAKNRDKLSRSFERVTLRTGLRNAAAPVRKRVQGHARAQDLRESGDLIKGIATKAIVGRPGHGIAFIGYRSEQFYGGFHELGTSQIPAKPHLRPGLDDAHQAGEVTAGFVMSINKTIAKVLKKF